MMLSLRWTQCRADIAMCLFSLVTIQAVVASGIAPWRIGVGHIARGAEFHDPQADREATRRVQDATNNALLLQRLQGVDDRRARFVSVLVALRGADDPEPLVAFGRWEGEILTAPRGQAGFGYDPLMHIPALGRSVAELDLSSKNRVSHRALAAASMAAMLRQAWHLGTPHEGGVGRR